MKKRWSQEDVDKILQAIENGEELPEFVNIIPLSPEQIERISQLDLSSQSLKGYDLRGLPLGKKKRESLNLSFAHLEGADLSGANLSKADLFHAHLEDADISGANLTKADLSRASLQGANLQNAILKGADLGGADLEEANLSETDLTDANLFDANLENANLSYANLTETILSRSNISNASFLHAKFYWTYLWRANLGEADDIRYIVWGGKPTYRITQQDITDLLSERVPAGTIEGLERLKNRAFKDQSSFHEALENAIGNEQTKVYGSLIISYALASIQNTSFYIGEEKSLKFPEDYLNAEIIYRDLEQVYRDNSMDFIADEFNYRENDVKTQGSALLERAYRTVFYKWTYGYGSRPFWILLFSMSAVGAFTLIYVIMTLSRNTESGIYIVKLDEEGKSNGEDRVRLSFNRGGIFLECFYFSLITFVTFGFDILQPKQLLEYFRLKPISYVPLGWTRIVVGVESALGIYILALLFMSVLGLF